MKEPKIKQKTFSESDKLQKNWSAKIQKLTQRIEDQYPELYNHLKEMTVMIPDEKNPALTETDFLKYYNSLNAILKKHILEYPKHSGYEK